MILFRVEMAQSIRAGLTGEPLPESTIALGVTPGKDCTRRMPKDGKSHWKVGSIHMA